MEQVLLLVDDEPNILAALSRLFRREGYRILTANGGQEGLDILQREPVSVIISDQRMPGMTGSEFLSQAKQVKPDTVRIILSGYTELNSVTDAINRGAVFRFLTKPWEDELLRTQVRDAFHHYSLGNENKRLTDELSHANAELERRVEQKTREVLANVHTLRIAQEILDQLPIGVIGIGEDGLIATANQMAVAILDGNPLTGMLVEEGMPPSLCQVITLDEASTHTLIWRDRWFRVECKPLGRSSLGRGCVVLLIPEQTR
ncbi:response regulator [Chitinivorax sp. B]|uniref:response regulator n=1 Tax=Chitinivorax sp. B TaxID=2502235 RepID=UPI0010F9EF78|nr:response regulator [Chitinivorax sp. B]